MPNYAVEEMGQMKHKKQTQKWIARILAGLLALVLTASVLAPLANAAELERRPGLANRVRVVQEEERTVLQWEPAANADAYTIFSSTDGQLWMMLQETEECTYEIPRGYWGYAFKIRSYAHQDGQVIAARRDTDPIYTGPELTAGNLDSGVIALRWGALPGVKHYEVYASEREEGPFSLLGRTRFHNCVHPDLSVDDARYYRIRAVYEDGQMSRLGAIQGASVRCAAPELTITVSENGQPRLSWDQVPQAERYVIYRSQGGKLQSQETVTADSWVDTSAESGQSYTYAVTAASASGRESNFSNTISLDFQDVRPEPQVSYRYADGKPTLRWEPLSGAQRYQIYRSLSPDKGYAEVFSTRGTSYVHASAETGKTYYYRVKALAEGGAGVFSQTVQATCQEGSFQVRTGLRDDGKPRLDWEVLSDARGYEIYRSDKEEGEFTLCQTTEGTAFADDAARPGQTWYYQIKILYAGSSYAWSPVVSQSCESYAFSILSGLDRDTGCPVLKWEQAEGVEYEIHRGKWEHGTYEKAGTGEGSFVDTAALPGETWFYKARALLSDGTEVWSNTLSGTGSMVGPKVTLAHRGSDGKPELSWEAVPGAQRYEVSCSLTASGTYNRIATTTELTFAHTDAAEGQTYYYKVLAVSADGTRKASSDAVCGSCREG